MVAAAEEALEIRPQPKQEVFLSTRADIAIYGGAAGSGKTYGVLLEPLRHLDNPNFGAVVFRRTCPQITNQGGMWDESRGLYPWMGGVSRTSDLSWTFPGGTRVSFRHLEDEKSVFDWQGSQVALLIFDELTHFTQFQFFYMLSRNRSNCGVPAYVRATCNADADSWLADFLAWWIDQATGYAIPERSGVIRYLCRINDTLHWADTPEELTAEFGEDCLPKSVTFVNATLDDNPALTRSNPSYRANLRALPLVERKRLEDGNWKIRHSSGLIFQEGWYRYYRTSGEMLQPAEKGAWNPVDARGLKRFATIDTAGTAKDKDSEAKGNPHSWSVVAIWDYWREADLLFLRHIWREQVEWHELKARVPEVLRNWNVRRVRIEEAHYGKALRDELGQAFQVEMIGPTLPDMADRSAGAKLDRAAASRLCRMVEDGKVLLPVGDDKWIARYKAEHVDFGGGSKEVADQIDVSSYAAHDCRQSHSSWGGTVRGK